MDTTNARLCLLLHSLPNLDNRQLRQLLRHFGSPQALWAAEPPALLEAGASAPAMADLAIARKRGGHPQAPRDINRQLDALLAVQGQVVALGTPDYPHLLAAIHDPPPLLYLRGSMQHVHAPQLAMVGSRKASPPGSALPRNWQALRSGLG